MAYIPHAEVERVAFALYTTRESLSDGMFRARSNANIGDMMVRIQDHAQRCTECDTWFPPGGIEFGACRDCNGYED
jgi:hypothetical protein